MVATTETQNLSKTAAASHHLYPNIIYTPQESSQWVLIETIAIGCSKLHCYRSYMFSNTGSNGKLQELELIISDSPQSF